jgi:L-ascorbate metabolism protein UlaG (beta-lactamase superfamily)
MNFPIDMKWLGHAGFIIKHNNLIIAIDPYDIEEDFKADIILITHEHFDHCSPNDIDNIYKLDTIILAPKDCKEKIRKEIIEVLPKQKHNIKGIKIETTHSYNIGKSFHPKVKNWVGYVIEINKNRLFHIGDSDRTPDVELVKADIVLIPISGKYTMDVKEAAVAIEKIKPKWAIPMHYGSIVGTTKDADEFEKLCPCAVYRFD